MCGRFTLTWSDYDKLAKELEVDPDPAQALEHAARFNIAPTQMHWILRTKPDGRRLTKARWGLINTWDKDAKQAARKINARSERADTAPAFRAAFARRRCVIPADGFYEWTGTKGDKRPVWFHDSGDGLLRLAGLYEPWRNPETGE
jgi:putative SOS response-associated peptidase YedK